jgi:hypothetical protein
VGIDVSTYGFYAARLDGDGDTVEDAIYDDKELRQHVGALWTEPGPVFIYVTSTKVKFEQYEPGFRCYSLTPESTYIYNHILDKALNKHDLAQYEKERGLFVVYDVW